MAVNYINLADIDRGLQQAQLGDMQIQNQRDLQTDRAFARNQKEQANQQQMRIRDIYAGAGGDLNKARTELYNQGFYEQGGTIDKQLGEQSKQKADIDKTTLETNAKRIGLIGNGMKFLIDNPTKENALMTFNQLKSTGVMPQDMYDQLMSKLPDDPAMIKQGAEVLFRSALDAKDQLAKFETRDAGGTIPTQQIDPITGEVKIVSSISKTQSPDSIANNQRMMAEGAANRGVTMRGQNMADARAQEKAINPPKTQLSSSAQKELFEADEMVQASKNALGMLQEAKKLNKTAYSGFGAKPRAIVASNLGVGGRGADDAINLDNLMTGQALESLKATFGGMPTEGERKILLDIQASADKTPAQRQTILDRAEKAAERRIKFNESKAKSLRSGTYFTQQQSEPQTQSNDVLLQADKILGL